MSKTRSTTPQPDGLARPPAPQRHAGWAALVTGTQAVRSLALAGGVALHAVNVYIATTILPSVVAEIGGLDYYAWNTTLFVVASILGSALAAGLLRRAGPRGAYAAAAAIFALGTLACALAPAMAAMLAGRAVQGLGGGLLFALSYAMIRLVFAEALWPRAMALVSGMWGVATLVGPAVGGVFAELDAWRVAFWSLLPVTAAFAALAWAVLPRGGARDGAQPGLPLLQLVLLTSAVLIVSAASVVEGAAWNLAGLLLALGLVLLLARVEALARHRLLPRGAFSRGGPLGTLYLVLSLLAATVTSSEIFVPLFLQVLHGQTPLAAGYLAALMAAGWTLGSVASAGAEGRASAQVIRGAPVVSCAGMLALAFLLPRGSGGSLGDLAVIGLGLAAVGFGVGLAWPHLLTRILQAAPAGEGDLASASLTTVQLFATAVGAALAGMVANLAGLTEPGGPAGAADAALWLFAVFAAGPAVAGIAAAHQAPTAREPSQR
jgi:MFS family permease